MYVIVGLLRGLARRRRLWLALLAGIAVSVAVAAVLAARPPVHPQSGPSASMTSTSATPQATDAAAVVPPPPQPAPVLAPGEPKTSNYGTLAEAAARAIYTWDARSQTYSEVYERLRSWWSVLPDGSNPLTVMAQEFQATGVTAASFSSLSGTHAYRTASVSKAACDGQLAQVQQNPAPWDGLHVCTFTLKVAEHQTGGTNSYTTPVSVMVNCPPAATAPVDRCAMVGFYASASRIVY
ncbi:hypothetical protein [Arthrobacter wenxiniae]|uniref:Uncharacterized protein n=1 Tax=Arthrobacter wenxiniae TaxID=2713570 RepID=A0A7Y7IIL5_9MICC|nr:hypothetical protein [Arthrobacter wenxiniae]NVM96137.1 hypothetical protein [Arthrobacter wenxiniae]